MRTRQAQQLQADVYALLDEVTGTTGGGFATGVKPTPADGLESLNQGWCTVYGKLIQAGITWNMQTTTFNTISGQDTYGTGTAFAATYWKTMGVDVQITPGLWRPAHRFQFEERDKYQLQSWAWPEPILYDIWGGTADVTGTDGTLMKLIPVPNGSYAMRHFWFPAPQRLVSPTDVFDGVMGAERAIVFGAAQECAYMLEQFELGDRWGAMCDRKIAELVSMMRDRIAGEAPMARVVRGRPTLWRQRGGGTGRWPG